MQKLKNLKVFVYFLMLINLFSHLAKSNDECFEGVSRAVFKFNMVIDDIVLEPIAKGYNKLPNPVKKGTNNFTSNISTLLSIPNNVLQGNFNQLGHSIGSFIVNTTVGVLGFLNPAEKIGLKPNKEDVGQTLGSYGLGPGCYFCASCFGPTTLRDSVGMLADTFIDPFAYVTIRENEILGASGNSLDYYSVKGTSAVDFRSKYKNFQSLEKNSLDLYSSIKVFIYKTEKIKLKTLLKDRDEWENIEN